MVSPLIPSQITWSLEFWLKTTRMTPTLKLPSWVAKTHAKVPSLLAKTLNCLYGWLKHDKLPSWVAKTHTKVSSWELKCALKCPFCWQNMLNCPNGWLKHDKLPSWVPKDVLKCPLGSLNACWSALLSGKTFAKVPSWELKHALKCPLEWQNIR